MAVADAQNVTRAAAQLRLSQPPLSRQIRALPDELEVALFEQGPKSVRLTDAGKVFPGDAAAVLPCLEEAVQTVKAVATVSPCGEEEPRPFTVSATTVDNLPAGGSQIGMPPPTPPGPTPPLRPPSVFLCYARSDNKGKQRWLNQLMEHLRPFVQRGSLSVFYDEHTESGETWEARIRYELETCRIAVLLVSEAFLNSKYIPKKELPMLLRREQQGLVRLIPMVLNRCTWDRKKFRYSDAAGKPCTRQLSELQAPLPTDEPLAELRDLEVSPALCRVAEEVAKHAQSSGTEGDVRPQVVVSYDFSDRDSADAIARALNDRGYRTGTRVWRRSSQSEWVSEMEQALESAERVVTLLSPSYVVPHHAAAEWASKHRLDPLGKARALIPVLLRRCDPGELRNERGFCDLVDLDGVEAVHVVVNAVEASMTDSLSSAAETPAVHRLPTRRRGDEPPAGPGSQSEPTRPGPVLAHVQEVIRKGRFPDLLLHTFYGLSSAPIHEAPLSYTSVYYLWADAEGGTISAGLEPKDPGTDEPRHFVVRFQNAPGTYSGNVAFRPGGMSALDNSARRSGTHPMRRRFLAFEARRPEPEPDELSVIALSYRIIDRLGTHWMLNRGARVDCVGSSGWATFRIDLAHDGWSVFTSDGNYLYADRKPDFTLLVAVVIDFGSDEGESRLPGSGRGVVHLRHFRLESDLSPEVRRVEGRAEIRS